MKLTCKYHQDSRTLTLYFPEEFDTTNLADASVTTAKLATNSVTTLKIVDAAVESVKLATACITSAKVASEAIGSSHLQDALITTAKIANFAVSTDKLADLLITAGKLATNAVTETKILNSAITNVKLADSAVDTAKLNALSVTAAKLAASSIGDAKLDRTTDPILIGTADIVNASITSAKIGALAVGSAAIAGAAITNAKIGNLAVDSAQIADAAITSAKIGALAVGAAAIASGAIGTAKIADAAIISAKIDDASITTAKIYDLAVVGAKIANATILGGHIAASTITADKFYSTLYGDMNQAMDYVKTVLGAGDEYEHDMTNADLAAGTHSTIDADTHIDYGSSIRIATAVEWDDVGAVWDTGTWDEPTAAGGNWTSASNDIGASKTLQLSLRFTQVEETPASTTPTIKAQYSILGGSFGANSPAFDDGLWETLPIRQITGNIYKAVGALFTFRYFKIKVELATTTTTDRIILRTMTFLGNVVNLFGQIINKAIAAGGATISLSGFNTTPAITVTPVGATLLLPLITAQSLNSVTVKLYNLAGNDVGGNANLVIIGI
ncbi:MAG: hypothetical protein Q7J85_07135 [Bacillota bacterium]|nr:hypothetical protein [Bacillota bacterium]